TDGAGGQRAIDLYRQTYKPSERQPQPLAGLCIWALAADTMEEAQHHFTSRAIWRLHRDRGLYLPFESPETAAAQPLNAGEQARVAELRREALVGPADEVAARIEALAKQVGVEEIAIVTWTHDEAARQRSYALLADAFGLKAA